MSWITRTFGLSVGKKPLMAISGFCFYVFLSIHLFGNLTIYWGKESFNSYVEHLHSLGPLIKVFEVGLLISGITHVGMAIKLFIENRKARPIQYSIKKNAGSRTFGSATMPYTGIILFVFLIIHLFNFHFTNDKIDTSTFTLINNTFSNPGYVCFYIASVVAAALHVSHGFWSSFQTMGISHLKYNELIRIAGSIFALIIGVGFGFIPIYVMLMKM